jgi:GH43 family beta-xylosidase
MHAPFPFTNPLYYIFQTMFVPRSALLLLVLTMASALSLLGGVSAAPEPGPPQAPQISTVISPAHTPDPDVIFHEGYYYAVRSKIEVSENNTDPPNRSCWSAAQDQVLILKSRKLEDVFTNQEATSIIINRKSPFGGTFGTVSTGAFGIFSSPGRDCPSPGFWAPSLKNIDNHWYLFVTGHRNPDMYPAGEANFILESSHDDPMEVSGWQYRGVVDHQRPGLDGEIVILPTGEGPELTETVTLRENGKTITGQLYYVYSHNNFSHYGDQQLWLTRLRADSSTFEEYDADLDEVKTYQRKWSVGEEGVISVPTYDWERQMCTDCQFGVNEGPTPLYGPTKTFIFYSASFCATKYYSLGMLEYAGVGPGFPFSWIKHPRPVFSGDTFEQPQEKSLGMPDVLMAAAVVPVVEGKLNGTRSDVFGIGHNSFTNSPDFSEYWIVYHAKTNLNEGPEDREARVQQFYWTSKGEQPNFSPGPLPRNTVVRAPSNAEKYAIFCSENDFKGRMCTGLPEGRYRQANLIARGILLSNNIKSMKLVGDVSVKAYGDESESVVVWSASESVPVVEKGAFDKVKEVVVLAGVAPSARVASV